MSYKKMMENVPEGLGLEEVTAEDIQRSRLAIVQKGSPQIDPDEDSFIEGAKLGQIMDTALSTTWDDVRFICVDYRRRHYEWSPAGSLVTIHDVEQKHDGNFKLPNGNKISLTAVFTGWVLEPNSNERHMAFVSLASTQLRKAKSWITLAHNEKLPNKMKAPLFWRVWRLSSKKEYNVKGSFYGWVINRLGTIEEYAKETKSDLDKIISEAVEMNQLIKKEMNRYLLRSGYKNSGDGRLIPAESSDAFNKEEEF